MGAGAEPLVDLVVEDPAWDTALPDLAEVAERAARAALAEAGLDPARWTLSLLACDDARIAGLNARFRGREGPTNVLSWPAFPLAPPRPGSPPPRPPEPPPGAAGHLGDVAIALGTAAREAESADRALKSHVIHLILHGMLHCLGHDHETEADAALMEGIETRLLSGMDIADPYRFIEADAEGSAS